jgi:hypothetical protein
MLNNFISGSVGGFVGTALNTPCAFFVPHAPCSADATRRAAQFRCAPVALPPRPRAPHADARGRSSSRASRAPRKSPAWSQSTSGRTRRSRPSRARRALPRSTRASCRRCSGSARAEECCCWSWRRRWPGSASVGLVDAVFFWMVLMRGTGSAGAAVRVDEGGWAAGRRRVRMSLRMRRVPLQPHLDTLEVPA